MKNVLFFCFLFEDLGGKAAELYDKVCVRTCDQREALDTGKIGVLDGHDASLSKQLLWIVIDQLSVEEREVDKL